MSLSRRTFLQTVGTGAAALAASTPSAEAAAPADPRRRAVLVDATRCVGCRGCEAACSEANALPPPVAGDLVLSSPRTPTTIAYTVVTPASVKETGGAQFAKRQCMHCLEPACASACLVRALEKTPAGPVVYHANRCLGCRYCMVACPFGMPQFEYDRAVPYVRKCTFCADRQAQGLAPACTTVCPTGALTFGSRDALLEEARTRIYQHPDQYVHHVYGETEVGGTSWMYLSDVPFERFGLPSGLGDAPAAGYAQEALSGVPVALTLGPALLMGLYTFTQRGAGAASPTGGPDHG